MYNTNMWLQISQKVETKNFMIIFRNASKRGKLL